MISILLLLYRELWVISVKNFSGILTIGGDGSWVCEKPDKHKAERHPDPVSCFYLCRMLFLWDGLESTFECLLNNNNMKRGLSLFLFVICDLWFVIEAALDVEEHELIAYLVSFSVNCFS